MSRKIQINYLDSDQKTILATHRTDDDWTRSERQSWESWLEDAAVSHPGAPDGWAAYELVPWTTAVEVTVAADGREYRATRNESGEVSIDVRMDDGYNWEWCGDGVWDNGVTDCSATLTPAAYEAIDAAIGNAE